MSGTKSTNGQVAHKLHVLYCFDSILETLNGGKANQPVVKHTWNGDKFPLFVTWKKRHGNVGEWKLRGCIGTFAPKELSAGLREYAVIAAFHDSRFSPIVASELSQLRCDISLLTNFEEMSSNILDWTIGQHGIQIDFTDPITHRHYSGTYLPEVAREQGWTREETIEELIHKSGYRGTVNQQLKQRISLTRYQSEKESLHYDEYVLLREKIVNGHHSIGMTLLSATNGTAAASSSSNSALTTLKQKQSNGRSTKHESTAAISDDDDDD